MKQPARRGGQAVQSDPMEPQGVLLAACRRLLRPVVRILLRHGVTYRQLAALCKELYVEVASADYGLRGRPTNVSRTALLTGLDRKEVKRLRDMVTGKRSEPKQRQDRISRVLSAWFQDGLYSAAGKPNALPFESATGPSFVALVDSYGGDVPPKALLNELKHAGAVTQDEQGLLHAVTRYYMPAHTEAAALERAGSVLEDLGNTVAHNLFRKSESEARFERRATNTMMDARSAKAFREFLERDGQQFLERADAWLSLHEEAAGRSGNRVRLGVGLYGIEESS